MKKSNIVFLIIFGMIQLIAGNTKAQTGSYVPAYIQEQENWCWAACGAMIYWAYKPGSISQCQFVARSRDLENSLPFDCNNLSNSTVSPCTYPATFNSPQDIYTCGGSIENTLDDYGIGSTGYSYAFSGTTLTSSMTAKKICIARWGWNTDGGHFVVIYRYKSGNVYFNNPSSGATTWTYATFKTANNRGDWTHTLRMNSASVYGTTYYRNGIINPDEKVVMHEESGITHWPATSGETWDLNVYPNPATEFVNVLYQQSSNQPKEITVTDIHGKLVYKQAIGFKQGYTKVNVAQWAKGMYLVKMSGSQTVKQFVVQ